MSSEVLLCSDLDRTILPNGPQVESPQARPLLSVLAARPELVLTYVSGRHEALLRQAVAEYSIPVPDYAIGDVGTTIYEVRGDVWHPWSEWSESIARDWQEANHNDLAALFSDLDVLQLQEPEKQNSYKLSYYTPAVIDRDGLIGELHARLEAQGVAASLIWSVDETEHVGLLDVLPASANKLHAVEFLMERKGFTRANTVFAGDSGNDLPVLTSGRLQAVLVNNAHPSVVEEAKKAADSKRAGDRLYVARGGFLGMNGNYAAGVLEGLVHFLPQAANWLEP